MAGQRPLAARTAESVRKVRGVAAGQRRGGRCRHAKQAFESKQPHQGMQTRNS